MRQRIVIAIAVAANPEVLVCDEPTTALDVTIQAQILELIKKLKRERNMSVIFITHDLGVVANVADRIAVMYAGKIVEYGTTEDIFTTRRILIHGRCFLLFPTLSQRDGCFLFRELRQTCAILLPVTLLPRAMLMHLK